MDKSTDAIFARENLPEKKSTTTLRGVTMRSTAQLHFHFLPTIGTIVLS
jgi:hypothetical protein